MKGIFDDHVFHQAKVRSRRIPRRSRPRGRGQIPQREAPQDVRQACRDIGRDIQSIVTRRACIDRKTRITSLGIASRKITHRRTAVFPAGGSEAIKSDRGPGIGLTCFFSQGRWQ